jgi:hypothetical protein
MGDAAIGPPERSTRMPRNLRGADHGVGNGSAKAKIVALASDPGLETIERGAAVLILDLAHALGQIATIDALIAFAHRLVGFFAHQRQAVRSSGVLRVLTDGFASLCAIALRVCDRLHRLLLALLRALAFGGRHRRERHSSRLLTTPPERARGDANTNQTS